LISVTELTEELVSDRRPALLDVRWRLGGPPGIEASQAGHLPDAVFVDLDTCLAGPAGSGAGGRHPLPESGVFEAAMRLAGLHEGQPQDEQNSYDGHQAVERGPVGDRGKFLVR
jgi:thiosulfate/3-mercaptopyruvate sulfurtransferase